MLTNDPIEVKYEEDSIHDMYSDRQFVILEDNTIEMFDRLLKNVENEV